MLSQQEIDETKQRASEWAQFLALSLREWCQENGKVPMNIVRDELGLKQSIWQHIMGGKSITQPEYYARIFKLTGLEAADPRSIPPKIQTAPRTNKKSLKERAWTEEEWQDWLADSSNNQPFAKSETAFSSLVSNKEIPRNPQDQEEFQEEPPSQVSPSFTVGREYRQTAQRRFDALFEQIMSEVIPRRPDPLDHNSIDQLIWGLKNAFEKLGSMDRAARNEFAREHGRKLATIFSYVEAYTLTDEKKREQALSLIFGFNTVGEINSD